MTTAYGEVQVNTFQHVGGRSDRLKSGQLVFD